MTSPISFLGARLRCLALATLACGTMQAQAIIISSNSDALNRPAAFRFCNPAEVTPRPADSLCVQAGVNGANAAIALAAARSIVTLEPWFTGPFSFPYSGPVAAADAHRLVEIPDQSNAISIAFTNNFQHFAGTWQQAFSGPLLLQVAEVQISATISERQTYYYWLPTVQAAVGDLLRFEPRLDGSEPISFVGLYTLAPVPEPGMAGLMALGLGLLAWRAKRRPRG